MCYAPTRRSSQLITRATERINEGKLQEAERLLAAAKAQMSSVANVDYNGKRISQWYAEAQQQLALKRKAAM